MEKNHVMTNLAKYILPDLNDSTILRVNLSYLSAAVSFLPNFYYQLIDETVDAVKKLISLQILVILDSTGEYILIINESSTAERWASCDDMKTYFDSRFQALDERKSSIIITSQYLDQQQFLLQYYVYAGKSQLKHIAVLVEKIINQIEEFRNRYNKNNFNGTFNNTKE